MSEVSLYTALSGLQAARMRMEVASNNVSNVSTEGYTRQRADLVPRDSYRAPYGFVGSGVTIAGVARLRDSFLDATLRSGSDLAGRSSVRAELLGRAETILGEPDEGLTGPLADLWNAFEDLAASPANGGSRAQVLSSIGDLAARVRTVAGGWQRLEADVQSRLTDQTATVNDFLEEIASLNRSIVAASGGTTAQASDLYDRRDRLVDQLARAIGSTATNLPDGTVKVTLAGMSLVDGTVVSPLTLAPDGTIMSPSGVELSPGGEMGGLRDFLTTDLSGLKAGLDQFAEDLAGALNTQHQAGWVSATEAGGPLLTFTPGAAASTLTAALTDISRLALSGTQGPPFPQFDVANVQRLADLRTALAANGGTATLAASAGALAVGLGSAAATAKRSADSQLSIAGAAETARQSGHGVSLDEEMTELMSAQHAYEAAARVMTAVDETLDTLITRTGVVGR